MSKQEIVTVAKGQLATPEDLVKEWKAWTRSEKSPDTANTYDQGFDKFQIWLADNNKTLIEVKPSLIREWRDELQAEYSRATVNIRLTAVRQFYSWLIRTHDVPIPNPAQSIRAKGRDANGFKRDELTSADVMALLEACNDGTDAGKRDAALLGLMAYTAMRPNEARLVDMADFGSRADKNIIWVQGKGYTDKSDYVILGPNADAVLRPWLAVRGDGAGPIFTSFSNRSKGQRLSRRAARAIWEKRRDQAGIVGNKKTMHSLRHSAITNAIRHGEPLERVSKMARHQSVETTMRFYAHIERLDNPAEFSIDYENGV